MKSHAAHAPRIALALAGGGPVGAIYEVGALCAMEESLLGLDFTRLHHYVGVSAGAFVAASLANGISPRALCALFIDHPTRRAERFDPAWLMQPAYGEFARRGLMLPGLLARSLWQLALQRTSVSGALEGAVGVPLVVVSHHLPQAL